MWQEIGGEFPDQAWDHWMRLNSTSKGKLTQSLHHAQGKLIVECKSTLLIQMQRSQEVRTLAEQTSPFGNQSYLPRQHRVSADLHVRMLRVAIGNRPCSRRSTFKRIQKRELLQGGTASCRR